MAELIQNALINGKVILKGKNISAANVKKLGLGDHLFAKDAPEAPSEESTGEDPKD